MSSHVYILRDRVHPRFKIGKANDIIARARNFGWQSIDFQQSVGLRISSEMDAYILEKILHRTFHLAKVDPLEVIASGGSSDGASEWFSTSCWSRLQQYLDDNHDLYAHEKVSGEALSVLFQKQLEPSPAAISREQKKREKEVLRLEREVEFAAYRLRQLDELRDSLADVRITVSQELERLRTNGNIVGVCQASFGMSLVVADRAQLPSGVLLWSVKPLSTHYCYSGGAGSIMSSFRQVSSADGTIAIVGLPTASRPGEELSDTDQVIFEVLSEEFRWLDKLQSIPTEWIRAIFSDDFFEGISVEGKAAITNVIRVLPAVGLNTVSISM